MNTRAVTDFWILDDIGRQFADYTARIRLKVPLEPQGGDRIIVFSIKSIYANHIF
jgi:hypothetical protein